MPEPVVNLFDLVTPSTSAETPSSLRRARDHEVSNLEHRRRELAHAMDHVASLERQIDNVIRSIEELDEKLAAYTDQERITLLESEMAYLRAELKRVTRGHRYQPDGQITFTYTTGTNVNTSRIFGSDD